VQQSQVRQRLSKGLLFVSTTTVTIVFCQLFYAPLDICTGGLNRLAAF